MEAAQTMQLEILPRDLSAYRKGNTGIDYVHRFASGNPGPHVVINALTHGNELCGMVAACHLLDTDVRPRIGTLTVSFANVAAYESFDKSNPLDSRQLVHNLNRIWSKEWLDGPEDSPELRRARELRPLMDAADQLLDIHSTANDVQPFWVYLGFARNSEAALAIRRPNVHLIMPKGLGSGTPVTGYGRHGDPSSNAGAGVVVECGQHFKRASGELAVEVSLDFLAHFGLIDRVIDAAARPEQRRYELLYTHVVRSPDLVFARPLVGFETFTAGELVATEAGRELRASEDCTVLMPARVPHVGREGFYLARRLAE